MMRNREASTWALGLIMALGVGACGSDGGGEMSDGAAGTAGQPSEVDNESIAGSEPLAGREETGMGGESGEPSGRGGSGGSGKQANGGSAGLGRGGARDEGQGGRAGGATIASGGALGIGGRVPGVGGGGPSDAGAPSVAGSMGGAMAQGGGAGESVSGGSEATGGAGIGGATTGGVATGGSPTGGTPGVGGSAEPACDPTVEARIIWRSRLDPTVPPTPLGERVYVVSEAGDLLSLDEESGKVDWSLELPDDLSWAWWGPVAAADGTLYVPCERASLCALDPSDGSMKWSSYVGATPSITVVADDGTIYAGGLGVTALDPTDGSVIWDRGGGGGVPERNGLALGEDGTIFQAPSSVDAVFAINPEDGSERWHSSFGTHAGLVVTESGALYVVLEGVDYLYAVDPETGEELWMETFDGVPVIAPDGTAYIHYMDGPLRALDPMDGSELWTFDTQRAPVIAPDGTAYVSTDDGTLYALAPADGSTLWSSTEVGTVGMQGLGPDGTLYASSSDGMFYALDSANGSVIWSYAWGEPGYVYLAGFGTAGTLLVLVDDRLYAVSPSPKAVEGLACMPCQPACTNESEVGRCLPDGSGYELAETCPSTSMCQQDRCVDCPSFASRTCVDNAVYWADGCGRVQADLIEECDSDLRCHEGSCVAPCSLECSSSGFAYGCGSGSSSSVEHADYDAEGNVTRLTVDVTYANGHQVHCLYLGSNGSSGSCEDDTGSTCSF